MGRGKGKGEGEGRELSRLDPKHQRYRLGHKMGHSAHCRVLVVVVGGIKRLPRQS